MWNMIGGVIQIIFLLLKNKFEKDAEKKKRKDELHNEVKEAIKSGNTSRIVGVIDKLRL